MVDAIARVISLEGGHTVELFGLHVFRLENGDFVVEYLQDDVINNKKTKEFYQEFKNAHDAATCFEAKRKEWKLGFDYEIEK